MRAATLCKKFPYDIIVGVDSGSGCIVSSSQCKGGLVVKCRGLTPVTISPHLSHSKVFTYSKFQRMAPRTSPVSPIVARPSCPLPFESFPKDYLHQDHRQSFWGAIVCEAQVNEQHGLRMRAIRSVNLKI